ncbi:MAG: HlyD family efflux transporter periplasmic adaptor subunit [Sphingobacteriia bacterium]|nr:MAG: HlyD family efflux transporter periplasmic adaptor subunit [Sphingobacteriia bacterium]
MPQQEETYSLDAMLEAAKIERLDEADRIYSHEVREIISSRPVWIVRNGIALFFIIIGLLFTLTFFIHYPDLVKAPVRIVGKNLPKQVINKTEGRLVLLAAKENSMVQQGDLLAILQSNADYTQVIAFKKWIGQTEQKLTNNNFTAINNLIALNNLGDLQKNYQEVQQQLYQLSWSAPNGYFEQKKATITKDLTIIDQLKLNAEEQKKLITQDLDMQQNLLGINERMVKEKVIAPLELNKDKTAVLAKQQQLVQVDAGTIIQTASALAKQKELIELQKNSTDIRQNFITALLNAKSALAEWTNRYMLIATETGKLQYSNYFQENSWIKTGQELFYIIPSQPEYFAEVMASQQNFGKLAKGQQVNIALNSYQRNEFGILKGVIENIPAVPHKDTAFLIRVLLQNGLKTNYNKQVQFSNNLTGTAEIITAEATLADRLLYQWRGLWSR